MTRWTRFLYALSFVAFVVGIVLAIVGVPLLLGASQLMSMAVGREHAAHDAAL